MVLSKLINRFTCSEKQLSSIISMLNQKNMYPILDYINEDSRNHYNNYNKIINVIDKFPNNHFSIKLSSLNVEKNFNLSRKYANSICKKAIENNCKILVDAENFTIQDRINELTNELMTNFNGDKTNVYKTYQCYKKDTFDILQNDIKDKTEQNYHLGIKLVRGAYYNQDYKYGLLFNNITETHANYNLIVDYLIGNLNQEDKMMIASHNDFSVNRILENQELVGSQNIEFAQLLGMNNKLSEKISNNYDFKTFKYVPFGKLHESIPYLLRRLYENKDAIKHIDHF